MRIKYGIYIKEATEVCIREKDIIVDDYFYDTGKDTENVGNQLLTQGYADLTNYDMRLNDF